jgi:hypothetical protein
MWEGSGHHAKVWHAELARRHQVGNARLAVASGDPVAAVLAAASRADLMVLCWGADASVDRAQVVRGVLREATLPLLLDPERTVHAEPVEGRSDSAFWRGGPKPEEQVP